MKKVLIGLGAMLFMATNASALTFSFDYLGVNYGLMEVLQVNDYSLSVKYTASTPLPKFAEATGFGFVAPYDLTEFTISNPLDSDFTDDQDDLDWLVLTNLNAIPQPTNSSEVTKFGFVFGATDGQDNTINPPGILAGEWDIFYLNFGTKTVSLGDLAWTGVRLQSLPNDINTGSLFLVDKPGDPVPEPATMLLFGTGLAGLAAVARRRKN